MNHLKTTQKILIFIFKSIENLKWIIDLQKHRNANILISNHSRLLKSIMAYPYYAKS